LPLSNSLLAWSEFGGRPSLGRFVVVPLSFHLMWDIQSLIFFYNPTLICTSLLSP
jgi:hypothetical protein